MHECIVIVAKKIFCLPPISRDFRALFFKQSHRKPRHKSIARLFCISNFVHVFRKELSRKVGWGGGCLCFGFRQTWQQTSVKKLASRKINVLLPSVIWQYSSLWHHASLMSLPTFRRRTIPPLSRYSWSTKVVFFSETPVLAHHVAPFHKPSQPLQNAQFNSWLTSGRVQLKCDGRWWRTRGGVKGKLTNGVGSQYPSHYLGTWCSQHYYNWCAHLGCQ
jgi:hypothetical protein